MNEIEKAAQAIAEASAILIATGAGMGVDSGLPDFRGNKGFWNAYPPFKDKGLSFYDLANPKWFRDNPAQAWGFYGHRFNLYSATTPHEGFAILKRWSESKSHGSFVFTSNVDCHFQASGFDPNRIVECHGSFEHLQCSKPCCNRTWSAEGLEVDVDESTFLARDPLPRCERCNGVSRPNILMFGDGQWIEFRTVAQQHRMMEWVKAIPMGEMVVIEIGAGTAVPTVRWESESLMHREEARLVRINPRESEGPEGTISIAAGGLGSLREIGKLL